MNIQLINLVKIEELSTNSRAFHATLSINGKSAAKVINRGLGGENEIVALNCYSDSQQLINQAHKYVDTLGPIHLGDFEIDLNLSIYIDCLIDGINLG